MPDGAPALSHRRPGAPIRRPTTQIRCVVMQGGQGEVKHWAFNDPPQRQGPLQGRPAVAGGIPQAEDPRDRPAPDDGHPERPHLRRRAGVAGADARRPPSGPSETWKAEKVSIWQAGNHDNPFGMRLTTLMIAKQIARRRRCPCRCWPTIPNVQFNFYRHGIGTVATEMH